MKKYSQGDEQNYILEYFKGNTTGYFLDIGAYNPEVFSNTRCLFESGWSGVCVEPSNGCYPTLRDFYKGTGVEVFNCAVGNETGVFDFWDSNGDALSSTDPEHVKKWTKEYKSNFTKTTKQFYTLEDLIKQSAYNHFNFVSIDVENDLLGIDILKQVDLYSVGMICLESGYEHRKKVKDYMQGWKEVFSNAENIILSR